MLKQQPGLNTVRDDLLRLDFAQGDSASTAADAADAVARNPHDAFANYLLAGLRLAAGELQSAEDFARRSLAAGDSVVTRTLLADALRQSRSFTEAEREARHATGDAPGFVPAWLVLGCTLFDEEKLGEAAQALESAQALHPGSPRVPLLLARVRLAKGRPNDAGEVLRSMTAQKAALSETFRLEIAALQRDVDASEKNAF